MTVNIIEDLRRDPVKSIKFEVTEQINTIKKRCGKNE